MKNIDQSRRDMLRKTALFAVPTIVSFQLSETQVQASGIEKGPNELPYELPQNQPA